MTELTKDNFDTTINGHSVVMVDFWAPWCGPCRALAPVLSEVDAEVGTKAAICKVNVDENQELAMRYGVSGIPNVIFFKNGQVANSIVGFRHKEEYLKAINDLLA